MDFLYKESDTIDKMTDLIPYYPKDKAKKKFATSRNSINLISHKAKQ